MHTEFIVVSILLALEMATIGAPKVLQISAVRDSAEHLGVSVALDRMIGTAQVAAAVGLLLGIAFPTLAVVTAAVAVVIVVLAAGTASTTNL